MIENYTPNKINDGLRDWIDPFKKSHNYNLLP